MRKRLRTPANEKEYDRKSAYEPGLLKQAEEFITHASQVRIRVAGADIYVPTLLRVGEEYKPLEEITPDELATALLPYGDAVEAHAIRIKAMGGTWKDVKRELTNIAQIAKAHGSKKKAKA